MATRHLKKGVESSPETSVYQVSSENGHAQYNLIYKIEIVGVSMFVYFSRTNTPICTKHGMLIPWDQGQKEGLKLRKSFPSSIPG
jgi:hypothetical protein